MHKDMGLIDCQAADEGRAIDKMKRYEISKKRRRKQRNGKG